MGHGDAARGLIPAHAGKTRNAKAAALAVGAHPRSRGENSMRLSNRIPEDGSSPLTRGKRVPGCEVLRDAGLIPAHAGKTVSGSGIRQRVGAHPRSRGENASSSRANRSCPGSSPLTRGKRGPDRRQGRWPGLIPAHAGKTAPLSMIPSVRWAHPRSRGENWATSRRLIGRKGSSPLTRGKLWPVPEGFAPAGLIPAHAGKTSPRTRPSARCAAHPRSRGENR